MTKAPAKPYELTPTEQRAVDSFRERRRLAKQLPKQIVEIKRDGTHLSNDHPDRIVGNTLTMEAFGLTRPPELLALLQNVADLTQKDRQVDVAGVNQMLAQIAAVEPRDGIEAMLATQMAAVHNATLKAARQLRGSDTIQQQDSNSNALNRLARTFTTQVEALKRYRSKGEQKVIVEHVTVNEGGQAIVGAVQTGGGAGR